MGRVIVYDSTVKAKLEDMLEMKENAIGLILGQRTLQKDIIVYLCPILYEDVYDVADENEDEAVVEEPPPPVALNGNVPHLARKLIDTNEFYYDETWTKQHAKEVNRMLPGGIDILGLYITAVMKLSDELKNDLRKTLYGMMNYLAKDREWSIQPEIHDGVLLHICYDTKKYICQTYNIANEKNAPIAAEFKPTTVDITWHSLTSELAGDFKFPIDLEKQNVPVKKQLLMGLTPLFKRISSSVAVINGVLRVPTETIIPSDGKKPKVKQPEEQQTFVVDLLSPLSVGSPLCPRATNCVLMFDCKGTIPVRAYVHGKNTVEEAVKAVHQDIVRSVTARCEIQFEDLLTNDEVQRDPVVVYELPRRVFVPLNEAGILVGDYQFHGDTNADSLDSFKELFSLDVSEDDIRIFEQPPSSDSSVRPSNRRLTDEDADSITSQKSFIPTIGVALFAIVFGIVYYTIVRHT